MKFFKVWRHLPLDHPPLSETLTPSRTPSSVTYLWTALNYKFFSP